MEENKRDNQLNFSLCQRQISGISQSSIQDFYLETEEEVNEESSPVLQMSQAQKQIPNQSKNPLLANKGNATNGRILTEEDGIMYQIQFHSLQMRRKNVNSPQERNSSKKLNRRKNSKLQMSNMALRENLMEFNQQNGKDILSISLQEMNLDFPIIKKESQEIQSPSPLIKALTKSSTKKDTKQSGVFPVVKKDSSNKYILNAMDSGEITLNPKRRRQSFDDIIQEDSQDDILNSSKSEINDDIEQLQENNQIEEEIKEEENESKYEKEMNQLFKIETKFLFRQSSNHLRLSNNHNFGQSLQDKELLRTDTADFPMKLLTHAMLDPIIRQSQNRLLQENGSKFQSNTDFEQLLDEINNDRLQQQKSINGGTPRFATDEEIEEQELKMLLTFAFKDQEEMNRFSNEMTFIINQEPLIEKPQEHKIKQLKNELRRDPQSQKKTLIFTNIDGLFMFSSHAQIVKNCDRTVKIRKDGLKKTLKLFYRPHLHTFMKTLSKYFELILYLKEDYAYGKQWAEVLNQALDGSYQMSKKQKQTRKAADKIDTNILPEGKYFNIILTKEQCIIDRHMRVICRNKDLFLEGRSLKNILFITNDIRDMTLVHQNAIYVSSYHGNKYENTLAKLKVYLLKHILECGDVRDIVKRDFLSNTKQHKTVLPQKTNKDIFLQNNNQNYNKIDQQSKQQRYIDNQVVKNNQTVIVKQQDIKSNFLENPSISKNMKSNSDQLSRFKEREEEVQIEIFVNESKQQNNIVNNQEKQLQSYINQNIDSGEKKEKKKSSNQSKQSNRNKSSNNNSRSQNKQQQQQLKQQQLQ